ncbi:Type III restriction enzyme, res subunit [Oribacterium sp. KHPX15]|uniref:ATP-binding domain-containing protein n=1 Tax=Oribacterium sp. KHPX15 TaxID=1855342 RepID=UPI00089987F2|nr:ATP-binding domain-containing protein [Oribacterium sp. KHPX15]SEA76612.1 Type III restriction enzyme, res subunit [Oribacterium sp. KHPX15]
MAIMIPEAPRDYDPLSLEGEMFNALRNLPIDYYVIHSFKNVFVEDNVLHEGEADFVIFNPSFGIICVEAKAGHVKYQGGCWKYASDKVMKHGGPYNQASQNKWDLLTRIQNSPLKDLQYRCKLLHAVWFPSISEKELSSNRFPPEFDRHITMTMEALEDPKKYIDSIFKIELENNIQTNLSENDTKRLIREIICPEFDIFPSSSFDVDLKNITFNRLLEEQKVLLNYLVEQKSAVINGAAGTGKTMIAVEKATRHANQGDKVLFLCFNAYLREHLEEKYSNNNIDFMTIDGFACKICKTSKADYKQASDKIVDMYLTGSFPYKHVIVDEGQDFGKDEIEESDLLQAIHDTVVDNDEVDGTFYVFYDKLQLIQANAIPSYIADADCKLTLYKNCRNTENIALTSLKPITERTPKLYEGAIKGVPATIHFCDNEEGAQNCVSKLIEDLKTEGISDVVILTCNTETDSILASRATEGKYKKKLFTTCRKFKGLEADAIVMVDVDETTFDEENVLRYYVGASRARVRLEIVTLMNDNACTRVLNEKIKYSKKIKKPMRELAYALNALPSIESNEVQ